MHSARCTGTPNPVSREYADATAIVVTTDTPSGKRARRSNQKTAPESRTMCNPDTTKRWNVPVRSKPSRNVCVNPCRSPNSIALNIAASCELSCAACGSKAFARECTNTSMRPAAHVCAAYKRHRHRPLHSLLELPTLRIFAAFALACTEIPSPSSSAACDHAPGSRYVSGMRNRSGTSSTSPQSNGKLSPLIAMRTPPCTARIVETSGVTSSMA